VFAGWRWACAKQGRLKKKVHKRGRRGSNRDGTGIQQAVARLDGARPQKVGAIPVGKQRAKRSRAAVVRF